MKRRNKMTQNNFLRIFSTIKSILDSITQFYPVAGLNSCIFYSFIGSGILQKYYNIDAEPASGLFGIMYDYSKKITLIFGNQYFNSDLNHFHSWIEFDDMIVDFMSPLYGELALKYANQLNLKIKESKMFLKKRSDEVTLFTKTGDFIIDNNNQDRKSVV